MCYTNKLPSGCADLHESCFQQNVNTSEGVCKCRVGYEKQNGVCTLVAITTTPDPHENKPITPEPRDSDVSGNFYYMFTF